MSRSARIRAPSLRASARARWLRATPLALLALGACGGERALPGRDLLARLPAELREEPGVLSPGDAAWARLAADGWRVSGAGADAVAWSLVRQARVTVPLLVPRDVELALALRPPPGLAGAAQRLAVRLNGRDLGEVELADARTVRLAAPANLWRRGDNELSFAATAVGRDAERDVFFGLAELRTSNRERRVARREQGYALPDGCGVALRVESLTDGVLRLAGTARGAGELALVARAVDRWSGTPAGEPLAARSFRADGGALEGACPLPRARATVEIELTWHGGAPGSVLELDAFALEEAAPPPRRSVLFVSIDTLSAQHMSLYGHARETTPHLEEFARDAVLFRNCRANAPWTIPSYMAQFTGLLPLAHMLPRQTETEREPDPWELHQIAPNRWTLAEFFRAAGYRTAAFVDNPWLAHGFGFARGFDLYDSAAAEIPVHEPDGGLSSIVPRALAWLDARPRDEPFFLFVQAFDPHAPYTPVPPWKGRFGADRLVDPEWKVPVGREQSFAYGCIPHHVAGAWQAGAELPAELAVAPIAAAYDEKILEVDAVLARLFAGLRERGLYDEILIVFSADHGESTTGHDFFFGHALLYNDVLHVPLIVRLPGGERRGSVVEPVVQLVDLYPTLLEFVTGDGERGLHGVSFLPLARGAPAAVARGVGYAEWGMMEQASVEHDGWKLIATQPLFSRPQTQLTSPRLDRAGLGALCPELAHGYFSDAEIARALAANEPARALLARDLAGPFMELYRVADDPRETRDLAAQHPEQVTRLLEYMAQGRALGKAAQEAATILPQETELDDEQRAELEALGYGGR